MSQSRIATALDASLVDFVTSHVSIHLAAVNEQRIPTLVRGVGCRLHVDGLRLVVLFPRPQAEALLRAVQHNRRIAAVFNEPETHRTVQLKGDDATLVEVEGEDHLLLAPYLARFSERLRAFAVPEIYSRTLCACAPSDLVALAFTPLSAYRQTPGSGAGNRMALEGESP